MTSNAENVSIWWRHHVCPIVPKATWFRMVRRLSDYSWIEALRVQSQAVMTRDMAYGMLPSDYYDVIMDAIASQIISLMIVYSTVYSDADQSKHQSSASLALNSPHKWPVTRKMFPFDDVIMFWLKKTRLFNVFQRTVTVLYRDRAWTPLFVILPNQGLLPIPTVDSYFISHRSLQHKHIRTVYCCTLLHCGVYDIPSNWIRVI